MASQGWSGVAGREYYALPPVTAPGPSLRSPLVGRAWHRQRLTRYAPAIEASITPTKSTHTLLSSSQGLAFVIFTGEAALRVVSDADYQKFQDTVDSLVDHIRGDSEPGSQKRHILR